MRMAGGYVHGYSDRERERLRDQASTLAELLHGDTRYADGSSVLEVGCGVGAQSVILARNSPGARFTCVDLSAASVGQARARAAGLGNLTFAQADLRALPFPDEAFDHAFVCFVLEHLADPMGALAHLSTRLKPGGTLTVVEGDHGSTLLHPESADARRAIDALVRLQAEAGGDARIGRRLQPLLAGAGFGGVTVSPRIAYADAARPEWIEGFTRNTFIAMVEGVRDEVLRRGLLTTEGWRAGMAGLARTAEPDGSFCYTFFKAVGVKRLPAGSTAGS
jgi:SAM-dependent methyltransferase